MKNENRILEETLKKNAFLALRKLKISKKDENFISSFFMTKKNEFHFKIYLINDIEYQKIDFIIAKKYFLRAILILRLKLYMKCNEDGRTKLLF